MTYSYTLSINPNDEDRLFEILLRKLSLKEGDIRNITIRKKSVDARKKPEIFYTFTVSFDAKDKGVDAILRRLKCALYTKEAKYVWPEYKENASLQRPVVVGFGPAGMFASLYLAKAGLRPIVIERGSRMEERIEAVNSFFAGNHLKPDTNVQFGEGGAGTFSDGKLNTGVKDKEGRIKAVLKTFTEFGADESILYDSRAHMGTDVIRKVVVNIREKVLSLGGEFYFDTVFHKPIIDGGKLTGIEIIHNGKNKILSCSDVILAIGHSSRDTYEMLHKMQFPMEPKSFAVGFRVLHEADFINESQYGKNYREKYRNLPTAYYKLARSTSYDRNVYSFCMCPGGFVVNASSEEGKLAVNGMSNAAREGKYSNAAIVMNIGPKDYGENILSGMEFQRKLEEKAFQCGNGKIPVQFYSDFKAKTIGDDNAENYDSKGADFADYAKAGILGGVSEADLTGLFQDPLNKAFVEGMEYFNTCIRGYADYNPLLAGVESRTSAPLRILRDESYRSLSVKGILPCGEGAGYAGGIVSAAVDGLKCAEAVCKR